MDPVVERMKKCLEEQITLSTFGEDRSDFILGELSDEQVKLVYKFVKSFERLSPLEMVR